MADGRHPVTSGRFSGNNQFRDLRGKSWAEAERALEAEEAIFAQLEDCTERLEMDRLRGKSLLFEASHHGLDLGTIAAVYAISAAGGIPVNSCNAGSFGGCHGEPFPIVGFYWPHTLLATVRQCANETSTPMWTHHGGELVIGADYIRRFLLFAAALLERRNRIDELRATTRAA